LGFIALPLKPRSFVSVSILSIKTKFKGPLF
jgi:hypothetical protein